MAFLKGIIDPSTQRLVFSRPSKGIEFRNPEMTNKDTNGGHRVVTIQGIATGVAELSQGALFVTLDRGPGYITTSWGGAEDLACRIQVSNYALQTASYGGMRALYVYARQYSGGSMANMYAALISADDRGSGASIATIQTCTIALRCNGIVSAAANVLVVEDNSQGSITPTTALATAMIRIRSTQPVATGIRKTCIHFETSGSGTGWTHAFSFQTAAGLEGFTQIADGTLKGNVNGYIKVYDVATNQTLYLNCYDTVPS
jgi:hypothetical protein